MIHIHRASYLFALCATMLTLCTPVDVRGQNNDLANFFYRAWAHGAQQAHERYLHESMLAQDFFLHILQQQHEREMHLEEMRQAEIRSIRLSAYEGNPGSQYLLGLMYLKGEEGPPQYAHAIRWLRQSAEQGWADAQVALGLIFRSGAGIEKNFPESFKWFQMAAADPYHAEAQFYLGLSCLSYVFGEDVLPNFGAGCRLAPELIRKSAELGYADAQVILGHMYRSGSGVGEDLSEAVKWFKLAADQHHPEARFYLIYLYLEYDLGEATPNGEFAMVSLEKRFGNRTHADAQFLLSLAHRFAKGVVSDDKLAFALTKKAAELGYAPAYHYTGLGYLRGIGTTADVEEGVGWLLKAPPETCVEINTCIDIGLLYAKGIGVDLDINQALEWFARAHDHSEVRKIMFELGQYYENDNSHLEAYLWFYLADKLGHSQGSIKAEETLEKFQDGYTGRYPHHQTEYKERDARRYGRYWKKIIKSGK